jgi:hypothetical protein
MSGAALSVISEHKEDKDLVKAAFLILLDIDLKSDIFHK